MSKLIIRKEGRSHRQSKTQDDTRSQLREFLTTMKNHQTPRPRRLLSISTNLSPSYFTGLKSPQRRGNESCSLPAIPHRNKKTPKRGINQFQQHIISNYLNAHLKMSPSASKTITHKSKQRRKNKLAKVKGSKGSDNSTIQEAELQTLREDKRQYNQSLKDYSLKEQPMKYYVQQRLQRKKREWKEKSPLEYVTYFYQLGPLTQKQDCNPTLKHEKSEKTEKIQFPHLEVIPTFIKTYQPSYKEINVIDLIKKQTFTVVYQQNFLFFGEVSNNKRNGLGILIKDGILFEGLWSEDLKVKGLEKSTTGTYTGSYKNDKKDGRGEFRWANGELFSGEWSQGKKHGVGMWISPEGDSYMGEWKRGIVEGQGVHKCKSGQKYEGHFKNYLKSGWGKQSFPNGDFYQGEYFQGLPHGKGLYCWQNGATYQGEFIKGLRHGIGTLKNPKGFSFTGTFIQQFAQGGCQINYGNGDFYVGQLKKGKRNGKGTLRQSVKRKVFDGIWQDDEFDSQEP